MTQKLLKEVMNTTLSFCLQRKITQKGQILNIITADGDRSHEIKRCLLLGRKVMTDLDSILKSRDITLPTKVRLVKAMVLQWSCMEVKVGP